MELAEIMTIITPQQRNLLMQLIGQQRRNQMDAPGGLAKGSVNIVPPNYGQVQQGPAQTPTGRAMPPLRVFNK
jgi:hypothetical protein